jgi:hypothetical protein
VTAARTPTKQSLGRYAGLSSCAAAAAPTKKEFQIKRRREVKNTLCLGHAHFEKKNSGNRLRREFQIITHRRSINLPLAALLLVCVLNQLKQTHMSISGRMGCTR